LASSANPGGRADDDFRRRLRELRSARGLSQEQMARQLGVSFATVNRWEGGKTAPSARARRELERLEAEPVDAQDGPGSIPPHLVQPYRSQAHLGQSQPGQSQPGQSQPGQSQPGQSQPGQSQPGQSPPAQPRLAEPGHAGSDQTRSGGAEPCSDSPDADLDPDDSASTSAAAASSAASPGSAAAAASTTPDASGHPAASDPANPHPASPQPLSPQSPSPQSGRSEPAQSGFVGRESELAELIALLDSARLVCLTGVGGAGKTRMAVEAVRRSGFTGAVTFVPLGAVRDPRLVATTVAAALGLRDRPGTAATEAITAALDGPARLLMLDGVEHVRDEVAGLVRRMMSAAPRLRLVVTSQRVLGVSGELAWPVPPLGCPVPGSSPDQISASDAVALFVTRARERLPRFTLADVAVEAVGELCRGLDGLPLAIELAAGWIGTLSVEEILQRRTTLLSHSTGSRDHDDRTLRAVVQASYDLLDAGERELVQLLSVFVGSFTMQDARAVAATADDLLVHQIRSLVDSSWLAAHSEGDHNRFIMLSTLRDYAGEQLSGGGGAVRRRHAEYYASVARESEHTLASAERVRWVTRMTAATADLEAALGWAETQGEAAFGLEMSAALWQWWLTSGRLVEGRGWISRFLAAGPRGEPALGRALSAIGVLAVENGDYPEAVSRSAVALRIFESHGDIERAALAATVLGSAHRYLGEHAEAREFFERAMRHRAALGDRRGVSIAVNNLALLALDDGDLPRARDLFEQALLSKRQLGDPRSVAIGLINLSDVLIRTRRLAAAARSLQEAAALAAELGDRQLIGTLAANQGELAVLRQDWAPAAEFYREAADSYRAAGHSHDVVLASIGLGRALHQLGRTDDAITCLREAEALAASIANAQRLAEVRSALAEVGESAAAALPDGLTPRQGEVLSWVAAGLSNREVAEQLHLSVSTIERHLATIYRNLGLRGRVEAARYATRNGLSAPQQL
jgi:predicted ATPase/DNA-binding CsgD family transcriptional regulator/DNA-binding XRE family transcriptional regulator